jgi:ribosomal protein L22
VLQREVNTNLRNKMETEKTKDKEEKKEKLEEANSEKGKSEEKVEESKPEANDEKNKPKKETYKVKKTEAIVRGLNLHMSTKQAAAICKFIKGKEIKKAVQELKEVLKLKKAIPMKGEIPHRKGEIMSGRYPQRASKIFIDLLNTLSANSEVNGLETPLVSGAIANIASRPYGRFGSIRKKRSHVTLIAREKSHNKTKMETKKPNGRKKNN